MKYIYSWEQPYNRVIALYAGYLDHSAATQQIPYPTAPYTTAEVLKGDLFVHVIMW